MTTNMMLAPRLTDVQCDVLWHAAGGGVVDGQRMRGSICKLREYGYPAARPGSRLYHITPLGRAALEQEDAR